MDHDENDDARERTSVPAPRPERSFAEDDIHRILRKASELQERSERLGADSTRMTLSELRQVAKEAGIDPRFVDLAASHLDRPETRENPFTGGPYTWHYHTTVDGEVADEDRDQIVRTIRSIVGHQGKLEDLYGRMEWTYDDELGPLVVGVATKDGRTEIDVSALRAQEVGIFYGLGVPMIGVLGGALLSSTFGLTDLAALSAMVATSAAAYLGVRFGWRYRARWWERRLRKIVDRLGAVVHGIARPPDGETHALPTGDAARPLASGTTSVPAEDA